MVTYLWMGEESGGREIEGKPEQCGVWSILEIKGGEVFHGEKADRIRYMQGG